MFHLRNVPLFEMLFSMEAQHIHTQLIPVFFRDILRRLVRASTWRTAVIELGHGIGLDQDRLTDVPVFFRILVFGL